MLTLVTDTLHLPRPKNGVIIPISSSSSDHLDIDIPGLNVSLSLGSFTIFHPSEIHHHLDSILSLLLTHFRDHRRYIYHLQMPIRTIDCLLSKGSYLVHR